MKGRVNMQRKVDTLKFFVGRMRMGVPGMNERVQVQQQMGTWKPSNGHAIMGVHGMNKHAHMQQVNTSRSFAGHMKMGALGTK
jgi:hypothetical protein